LKQQAFGEVATGSMAVGAAAFAANGGAASAISFFACAWIPLILLPRGGWTIEV